ncbi:two-component regulator propeller domain-containing protein [Fodinibius halophilus]|uniref:Histidine kinase domain-containing protein n=1 Tax=Fodinibius halophilus TaxID=1736908 RepID=A0A6M1TMP6_9BACT|nr:two-component regulator propeller domain-containing protein [Fodinibius halophilus]NGP89660.1 hypothetical protein [Fodinibius halophilus]
MISYRRVISRIFFVIFNLLLTIPLSGIAQQHVIRHYSASGALPSDSVTAINQTHDGFIWIGSKNEGLLRFTGRSAKQFTDEDGLKDNNVQLLYRDQRDKLWVSTAVGGVGYVKGDSVVYPEKNTLIQQHLITAIAQDHMSRMWFGSRDAGVFVGLHGLGDRLTMDEGLPTNSINKILRKENQKIWVATSKGIAVVDAKTLEVERQLAAFTGIDCKTMMQDHRGIVWVGTDDGIAKVRQEKTVWVREIDDKKIGEVTGFVENEYGTILMGTAENGVFTIDDGRLNQTAIQNGALSNEITDLFRDQSGRTWVANKANGVGLFVNEAFVFSTHQSAPMSVEAVAYQDDKVWLGGEQGLAVKNTGQESSRVVENGIKVWDIEAVGSDSLILVTDIGLRYYSISEEMLYPFSVANNTVEGQIYDVQITESGTIFISTGQGVSRYSGQQFERIGSDKYADRVYWHMMADQADRLWLSTSKGMLLYADGHLKELPELKKHGFTGLFRYSVEDKNGDIWMGTNRGIVYYQQHNDSAKVTLFDNESGLLSVDTQFLAIDANNQLWHGTSAGLHKLDLVNYWKSGEMEINHYSLSLETPGLPFNHSAVSSDKNAKLWFGSKKGIVNYDPAKKLINKATTSVYLTDVSLGLNKEHEYKYNRKVQLDYPVTNPPKTRLSNQENNLTISYSGLNYQEPENIQYRYRLKGKEKTWTEDTGENKVKYEDLSPGNYVFQVQAKSVNGGWNTEGATFSFVIAKSIWSTYWFNILLVIGGVGVLYGSSQIWLNAYENRKLQHLVDYQTKELREGIKEKEVLLAEIHHRVKNNLAVISGLLELQQSSVMAPSASRALVEAQTRIQSIAMVHEKLYKNDTLANINFQNYIRELAEVIAHSFNKQDEEVTLHVDTDNILITIDQSIPCGLILNELLCNAFEHAFEGMEKGNIWITLKEEGEKVSLTIADDGCGLPKDWEQKKSGTLGLTLVQTLTHQLDGELSVKNERGACFEINFTKQLKPTGHLEQAK